MNFFIFFSSKSKGGKLLPNVHELDLSVCLCCYMDRWVLKVLQELVVAKQSSLLLLKNSENYPWFKQEPLSHYFSSFLEPSSSQTGRRGTGVRWVPCFSPSLDQTDIWSFMPKRWIRQRSSYTVEQLSCLYSEERSIYKTTSGTFSGPKTVECSIKEAEVDPVLILPPSHCLECVRGRHHLGK